MKPNTFQEATQVFWGDFSSGRECWDFPSAADPPQEPDWPPCYFHHLCVSETCWVPIDQVGLVRKDEFKPP